MRLVTLLTSQSWLLFSIAALGSLISSISALGVLFFVAQGMRPHADLVDDGHMLLWLAGLAVGTRWGARLALDHLSRMAMFKLRIRMAQRIATAPFPEIEAIGATKLTSVFTQDISELAATLPNAVAFLSNVIFLIVTLGLLAFISPVGAAELVTLVALGFAIKAWFERFGHRRRQAMHQEWQNLLHGFEALVFGAKEVHLDAERRESVIANLQRLAVRLRESSRRQGIIFAASANGAQMTFFLALWVEIFSGWGHLSQSSGGLATYGVSIIYLMLPLQAVVGLAGTFADADETLRRLADAGLRWDRSDEQLAAELPRVRPEAGSFRELTLTNLTYIYGGDHKSECSIGPFDLTMRRGEVVFIVGGNGSGKTTLAKLITGLYVPHGGSIAVDGEPLAGEVALADFRRQLSAIYGDFYSFEEFPRELSPSEIERSAILLAHLRIDHVVEMAEDGTFSRTRGLSSGERKRLALMVALLQDRSIYLFDEWAADQDPVFKNIFYRDILPELRAREKLVIAITHDDRYFDVADQLVMLERSCPPVVKYPRMSVAATVTADVMQADSGGRGGGPAGAIA